MSGLYNALFGVNPIADTLLFTLGYTRADCGRFRDCYIDNDKIVIYTRNGGGNRDDYEDLGDYDDDYDCTYAHIAFSFPEDYKNELTALASNSQSITPSEKWTNLIASLENSQKK
jgi:hypothetical protein